MKKVIPILLFNILLNIFISAQSPFPIMGGDWFYHTVAVPTQIQHGDWSPPQDRTFLFSIIISFLNTDLTQFWISQIISIILSSLYLIPAYFIAKKMFNEKVALISLLFMTVTPFLIFQTIYTHPKSTSMFFILSSLYFILYKQKLFVAGLLLGLGYLFHNYTVFYLITFIIILFYQKSYRSIPRFVSGFILSIIPHLLLTYAYYGSFMSSRFIYYPISIEHYASTNHNTSYLISTFLSTPIQNIIEPHITNFLITVTPAMVFTTGLRTFDPLYYYTHTYVGGLTTLVYISFIYLIITHKIPTTFKLFIGLPILFFTLLMGWKEWGLTPLGMHPIFPIIIIFVMNRFKDNKPILTVLFVCAIIETTIFIFLYNQFFVTINGYTDVTTLFKPYNITIESFRTLYRP